MLLAPIITSHTSKQATHPNNNTHQAIKQRTSTPTTCWSKCRSTPKDDDLHFSRTRRHACLLSPISSAYNTITDQHGILQRTKLPGRCRRALIQAGRASKHGHTQPSMPRAPKYSLTTVLHRCSMLQRAPVHLARSASQHILAPRPCLAQAYVMGAVLRRGSSSCSSLKSRVSCRYHSSLGNRSLNEGLHAHDHARQHRVKGRHRYGHTQNRTCSDTYFCM